MLVQWPILWQHLLALVLVWGWVLLAGVALLPWLRIRVGGVAVPLVGVVFWTLALYLLPFTGGLDVAAALVVLLAVWTLVRWRIVRDTIRVCKRRSWSMLVLTIGSLPFL